MGKQELTSLRFMQIAIIFLSAASILNSIMAIQLKEQVKSLEYCNNASYKGSNGSYSTNDINS